MLIFGIGQEKNELFASPTGKQVFSSLNLLTNFSETNQNEVPSLMSIGVVDSFEMVNIYQ